MGGPNEGCSRELELVRAAASAPEAVRNPPRRTPRSAAGLPALEGKGHYNTTHWGFPDNQLF